jgi:hypothetical protein
VDPDSLPIVNEQKIQLSSTTAQAKRTFTGVDAEDTTAIL